MGSAGGSVAKESMMGAIPLDNSVVVVKSEKEKEFVVKEKVVGVEGIVETGEVMGKENPVGGKEAVVEKKVAKLAARAGVGSSLAPFVPSWNLGDGSFLSVQPNAIDFARHAFPRGTVAEMESLFDHHLVDAPCFASAHSAFFLLAGTHRVEGLMGLNAEVSSWKDKTLVLEWQVEDLEKKVHEFDKKAELLVSDKMFVEEKLEAVEVKLEKATKLNEVLNV